MHRFHRAFPASTALVLISLGLGCSTSNAGSPPDASTDDGGDSGIVTPPEWDRAVTRPDDSSALANRMACKYQRGALPGETLGQSTPVDKDIPIDTVVVMMMENRSFDSYFGHLNKYANRTDIESAPDTASNPGMVGGADAGAGDGGGAGAAWQHSPHLCVLDTNHEWSGSHLEYDNGLMDGFYQANEHFGMPGPTAPPGADDGARALYWMDETDIPFYYQLASTFGIGDHYFCGLLGPTWPNRMFLYAATSFGETTNALPDVSAYPFPQNDASIFDELEKRHVSWNIYTDGAPGAGVVYASLIISRWGRNPVLPSMQFFTDATAGKLPQVAFFDPHLGAEGPAQNDEHPPADVQVGQKLQSDVVHALFTSPQWQHVALFLTYDEHGGFYDHVPPPSACAPDSTPAMLQAGDPPGGFDRYGVRVPLIVVSPYARKGFLSKTIHDHTSITRFLETKFKVPALTMRDANADPLLEFFDFANPPFMTPPDIPEPTVDPTKLSFCTGAY